MEMTKPLIDCMQTLRRRIRAEQGCDIRLSQSDAIAQMLTLACRSRDDTTQSLAKTLSGLSGLALPSVASKAPTPGAQQYRGATVSQLESSPAEAAPPARNASVRIYRGQKVYA